MEKQHRILVIGAAGMLGNALLRYFSNETGHVVFGSVRSARSASLLPGALRSSVISGIDVDNPDSLVRLVGDTRPTILVNCVGLVKQLQGSRDPLSALSINSALPHRLAHLAAASGARLVHLSTDCVFSGTRGMYKEDDTPDATDLYGRTKLLGEVDTDNAITLRTSIIGHELGTSHSLVCWFLSQQEAATGYRRAVFSGLPTVEIARVIDRHVLPNPGMRGLYHLSAAPIDKYRLLQLIAERYGKTIRIEPADSPVIDRSLDSSRFRNETGFQPEPWPELISRMKTFG